MSRREYNHHYRRLDTKEEFKFTGDAYHGLKYGLELANKNDCLVLHWMNNTLIGTFHPDWTWTNSFNERKRWTGNQSDWWEKTDLEPYNPFKQ